jgi:hypothetical protein
LPDNPHSVLPEILARRQPLDGEQAFRDWLAELCSSLIGKRVAEAVGLAPTRLSRLIHGREAISPGILARFGYRRVISVAYVPEEQL